MSYDDRFTIDCSDAVEWMDSFEPGTADIVVTDIAYESLEKHRRIGSTTRLKKRWFDIFPNERLPELFESSYRFMSKDSHLYFFCDAETMFISKPIAEAAGFTFWKPIVWNYVTRGMGYHYRAQCQFILFLEKGKRKLADLAQSDYFETVTTDENGVLETITQNRVTRYKDKYPTEKPMEVAEILISTTGCDGDTVVADPFCGSGSTGEATIKCGGYFLGNDLSEEAVAESVKRLRAACNTY